MSAMRVPQQVAYSATPASGFSIEPVIARLAGLTTPGGKPLFRQVRGAADLAAITEIRGFTPPEAFVVLMVEKGRPQPGSTRQPLVAAISIVLVARNYAGQQHGALAADAAETLKSATRAALVGWIPNVEGVAQPGARGMQWQQGGVVDYDAGTYVWSDVYLANQFIGSRPT